MNGHWIKVDPADGRGSFRACSSLPQAGKGPDLVLAQQTFGVNANRRAPAASTTTGRRQPWQTGEARARCAR